jgi:hypothetical protein
MTVRPILRPMPSLRAVWRITSSDTGKTDPAKSRAILNSGQSRDISRRVRRPSDRRAFAARGPRCVVASVAARNARRSVSVAVINASITLVERPIGMVGGGSLWKRMRGYPSCLRTQHRSRGLVKTWFFH